MTTKQGTTKQPDTFCYHETTIGGLSVVTYNNHAYFAASRLRDVFSRRVVRRLEDQTKGDLIKLNVPTVAGGKPTNCIPCTLCIVALENICTSLDDKEGLEKVKLLNAYRSGFQEATNGCFAYGSWTPCPYSLAGYYKEMVHKSENGTPLYVYYADSSKLPIYLASFMHREATPKPYTYGDVPATIEAPTTEDRVVSVPRILATPITAPDVSDAAPIKDRVRVGRFIDLVVYIDQADAVQIPLAWIAKYVKCTTYDENETLALWDDIFSLLDCGDDGIKWCVCQDGLYAVVEYFRDHGGANATQCNKLLGSVWNLMEAVLRDYRIATRARTPEVTEYKKEASSAPPQDHESCRTRDANRLWTPVVDGIAAHEPPVSASENVQDAPVASVDLPGRAPLDTRLQVMGLVLQCLQLSSCATPHTAKATERVERYVDSIAKDTIGETFFDRTTLRLICVNYANNGVIKHASLDEAYQALRRELSKHHRSVVSDLDNVPKDLIGYIDGVHTSLIKNSTSYAMLLCPGVAASIEGGTQW